MNSPITTHVLDISLGKPALGVRVVLERENTPGEWKELARGETDTDGRISDLLPDVVRLMAGSYRLTFDVGRYFEERKMQTFYPYVSIVFQIHDPAAHYHIPLLLSPYGYSTYRGN